MSHENFIAEAFYILGSSERIGKDKRAMLLPTNDCIWRSIGKSIFNLKVLINSIE